MQFDPRTVAREIPGVLDEVFPQLTPGVVARFNSTASSVLVTPLAEDLLLESVMQRAILFELGCVVGERFLDGAHAVDWSDCLDETVQRQRKFSDVRLPVNLTAGDQILAETVGRSLADVLAQMAVAKGEPVVIGPRIPGLEWIASGKGDFSIGRTLIEVKCSSKRFSSADYRQVAIYWLLSFAAAVEGRGAEWTELVLLNPRSGDKVCMQVDALLAVIAGGRTKVDVLQLFQALVGSRLTR
ncbi:hypothetical protein J2W30_006742 [Variovorax boronicumulans]|uniref:hypothetical protein n=1 Tax=Variovorax boronicumulans TaxID=436515 RepID=UPI0027875AE0|nr:hypothetical protein [Variovorax boronicumulans]MDQ0038954.1 hypothetical protein [Variovorax boronicumulans]